MGINDTSLPSLPLLVHLKPPPLGKFKLNTDGCSRGNPGPSTGATILRNDQGCMIFAACRYFSHSSSLVAELKVIILGLQQCLTQSYTFINVESDCLVLVSILNNDTTLVPWMLQLLWQDILNLKESMDLSSTMWSENATTLLIVWPTSPAPL